MILMKCISSQRDMFLYLIAISERSFKSYGKTTTLERLASFLITDDVLR